MNSWVFYFTTFVANATILIFEIAGARLLAPYLGTSVEVWAGTIAVILGGMACGYYAGGIIADRSPKRETLGLVLFFSGIAALLAWGLRDLIPGMIAGSTALPLTFSAMYTATLLFVPTTILLAVVSPFIAKFLLTTLNSSAQTIGKINAVGTVGSIVGAVATGSVLVPLFGLGEIFLGIAIALFLLSALVSFSRVPQKALVLVLALAVAQGVLSFSAPQAHGSSLVADISTTYNRIWLFDMEYQGEDMRVVMTDPFGIQCGMPLQEDGSIEEGRVVFPYLRAFEALARERFDTGEPIRALFLGGCNYSYPRAFLKEYPEGTATIVEIDPGMTEMARNYFLLNEETLPNMRIVHEDARLFVAKDEGTYDIIFFDIFGSSSNVPHHVVTREAFEHIQNRLSDNGIVIMNVIAPLGGPASSFTSSVITTLEEVFPESMMYQFRTLGVFSPQNLIMAATKGEMLPETLPHKEDTTISLFPADRSMLQEGFVLTDNYAPVEYLTHEIRSRVF